MSLLDRVDYAVLYQVLVCARLLFPAFTTYPLLYLPRQSHWPRDDNQR